MVQKNEQNKSEKKTTNDLLMIVFFKAVNDQPMTEDEQKFYSENIDQVEDLMGKSSSKKKTIKTEKAEKAEKEQAEKFRAFLDEFKTGLDAIIDDSDLTGNQFKTWLREQVKNVPVLHKSGSGDSNWDSSVSQSKLQKDVEDVENGKKDHTYWSAIYKIVSENNGKLDRDGVEKELAKIFPDRVNTAAGLGYRVYQATKKFSDFMVENENGKLEITEN